MVEEKDLEDKFENVFSDLYKSEHSKRLLGDNIRAMALPDATVNIVDDVLRGVGHALAAQHASRVLRATR